ncbi:MAG: pyridoxamine 5'-phosphate oxidase [Planctomycetota bacterium]
MPDTHPTPSQSPTNDIAAMRRSYDAAPLLEADVNPDPFTQFMAWFAEAKAKDSGEANAMTLATADADGNPSARIVLMKGFSEAGLVFYTHRTSHKGSDLTANPRAQVLFYWPILFRQVRIAGTVTELPPEQVEAYAQSRPRDSQLGAWASDQSKVIPDRDALTAGFADADERFQDHDKLPVPPSWTGYLLTPVSFEFWQGQPNRMHDRLRYRPNPDDVGWLIDRLAP